MPKATKSAKFYAVRFGREPGVYTEWQDCEAQIKGFKNAKYKLFSNVAEAEEFVCLSDEANGTRETKQPTQTQRKEDSDALRVLTDLNKECEVVYCDGACKGNGKTGSVAGIGVWWGRGDPRNFAERCPGDQTNNRAELIAIVRILETIQTLNKPLVIRTDSKYSINCFSSWFPKWQSNGFVTSAGEPVKNASLIRYLAALIDYHATLGQKIRLQHVKGHNGEEGNEGADAMANKGTLMPTLKERDWEQLRLELADQLLLRQDIDQTMLEPSAIVRAAATPMQTQSSSISSSSSSSQITGPSYSRDEGINWETVYCHTLCNEQGDTGIGIWWNSRDPRNMAERSPGPQTEERGGLYAIVRLLESIPHNQNPILIKTNSRFCVYCIKEKLSEWIKADFLASSGEPEPDALLIRYMSQLLDLRNKMGQKVRLLFANHSPEDMGYVAADTLASLGASMKRRKDRDWKGEIEGLVTTVISSVSDMEVYADCLADDEELKEDLL